MVKTHFETKYLQIFKIKHSFYSPIIVIWSACDAHLPYSKARLLEVADSVCDFEKHSLAVGKMATLSQH